MKLLVYFSRTSNIDKIVNKLKLPEDRFIKVMDPNIMISEKFVLLTYTDFLGQIPEMVSTFLKKNYENLEAVAGSGNRNFGNNFCGAAKKISEQYNVPLLEMFELSGDELSIQNFREKLISGNFYG